MKWVSLRELHRQGHYIASPRTLIFAGLFLLVFGVVGTWSFIRSLEPLTWKSVPCTVTRFTLTDDPKSDTPFGADVKFHFEFDRHSYESTKLGIPGWKESGDQIRHFLKFEKQGPVGPMAEHRTIHNLGNRQEATCYLPNGKPESAVLFRPSFNGAGLAFIAFAVIVGWILYQAHIHRDQITDKLSRKLMPGLALLFGTPGLFMLFFLSFPVWIESLQVRSWKEIPATVKWSEMRVSSSGGRNRSAKHNADICYEYEFKGRKWTQNQIYPGEIQGGNHGPAERLLTQYPAGAKVTCFVHPDKPERSVLIPEVGWAFLWTLFPLPFITVGLLVLFRYFPKKNL